MLELFMAFQQKETIFSLYFFEQIIAFLFILLKQ